MSTSSDRSLDAPPAVNPAKSSFTARIATWSARHRWWVLLASAIVIVLAVLALMAVGTETRDDEEGVGESGQGQRLLEERFRSSAPSEGEQRASTRNEGVIFSNPSLDVDDPLFRQTVETAMASIRSLPGTATAFSAFDTGDLGSVSEDRHAVLAAVSLEGRDAEIDPLLDAVAAASEAAPGFQIEVYSFRLIEDQFDDIITEDFNRILIFSLIIGLIILIFAFRALIAAVIPLVMAIGAIFSALGVAALVSQVYPLVELFAEMILLMGLAVGIDYSLFIVSRYRDERRAGRERIDAITAASNTTGRAVFYAGVTVILSLAGLTLTKDFTFISLALGAIIVVFIAIIASLTLLPALLAILGDKINRLSIPLLGRQSQGPGFWAAITDWVLNRPLILATLAAAVLIALAIPVGSLNLGFNGGADALPDDLEGKTGIELLERHFSSSLIVPAIVVVDSPDVDSPQIQDALSQFNETAGADPAFLGPFDVLANSEGNLLRIRVPLAGKVDDEESKRALKKLREEILPQIFGAAGASVYVSGDTAESVDFTERMFDSAPIVFAFVLGLSFLLLLFMFRSIVISIKALVLNLLSVAAVYGVLVMVFQWGWGIQILGSEETGIIESWLPLFLFGILFGLSMDYHMLLLNRIKEEYDKGRGNDAAVSTGIQLTAGQITSAAAIMIGVFAAFATSRVLGLQQFGVGLAVAVFIDVTIIRVVLLPATMKFLGEWNWYLPGWLEWLPRISPEEPDRMAPPGANAPTTSDD